MAPEDHANCAKEKELDQLREDMTRWQTAQNGSIQHIESRTDQIFFKLSEIHTTQNDLYKTIQEINVATLATVQRVADKRGEDFAEHEAQRAGDVAAENKRFSGIEKSIVKMEQRAIWANYMKRIPGKVWVVLVSVAGLIATILGILAICHVI